MIKQYVLGLDQSTQGTKALLFDREGKLLERADLSHPQIVNEAGWVEHDPMVIWNNTVQAVKNLVEKSGIHKSEILTVGVSNQRETAVVWDKRTGEPVYNAIVWQCARGEAICGRLEQKGVDDQIRRATGLRLSPYFSAAKIAWVFENVDRVREKAAKGEICCGTVDSWLVFKMTGGKVFKTDYSNASRTQLFHVGDLKWDERICELFGIPVSALPEVCDSDSDFGLCDFEGYLDTPIPIQAVLGDSHGALFGQGCHQKGMIKTTYGTGSSIMMNIGEKPVFSEKGVVTSLAWKAKGKVNYVLEGNINYTGAVITWLIQDMELIEKAADAEALAMNANDQDKTYLVPAFSGLGAPYWDSNARATLSGMSRITGRREIVRAALDCIAYQIADVVKMMEEESEIPIRELRVDGGPTRNRYLMQFQSDILNRQVFVPAAEELSGIGAAYMAGIKNGIYEEETLFSRKDGVIYEASMKEEQRRELYEGWQKAVRQVLMK